MEKEIKINIPEGYDDAVFDAETKTVKFIKKPKELVKTWVAYCEKHDCGHYRQPWVTRPGDFDSSYKEYIVRDDFVCNTALDSMSFEDKVKMETLAKLIMIRKDWVGDWKPDGKQDFAAIYYVLTEGFKVNNFYTHVTRPFIFPTEEMAKEFLDTFRTMLENVKDLI